MRLTATSVTVALLAVLAIGQALWAADPVPTKIVVSDMHCISCAKKMATKLSEVPGVAKVQADVQKTTMMVTPKPEKVLSPRALWEAVEKAGYKPSKIEGPSGTFKEKPKA
jgi:copper chaperone CopZ